MYRIMIILIVALMLSTPVLAGEQDSEKDKKQPTEEQIEKLRQAALQEAGKDQEQEETEADSFKLRGLSLQALNPEFSISGDFINSYRDNPSENEFADFTVRGLGLHLESYLDPYSRFKAAIHTAPEHAGLEEAYFMRYGVVGGINLTLGKFRQQFGVVNRWHKHALDWIDFPLPLLFIFGDEGLNQTGFAFDWSGSAGGFSHGLDLQITEGANEHLFAGNSRKRPSILARYKLFRDLTESTYLELGVTGLVGWNDAWELPGDVVEDDTRDAEVYGADVTVLWEPTGRMRYRNIEWRSEFYYLNKNIIAPDGSGPDVLNPWGCYSSLQAKVSRTVEIGTRFDYYEPDAKLYATPDLMSPLAVAEADAYRWLVAPYITWWQSPFVKFRLEYEHEDGDYMGVREDRVLLQCVFAAGPHKHERY